MENKPRKTEIIDCLRCKLPLAKQIRYRTVKRVEIIYRNQGLVGPMPIDVENKKLPLKITCPRCKKNMPLEFIVGELTGITFSLKGELLEITPSKTRRITEKDERKLHKVYLKLNSFDTFR